MEANSCHADAAHTKQTRKTHGFPRQEVACGMLVSMHIPRFQFFVELLACLRVLDVYICVHVYFVLDRNAKANRLVTTHTHSRQSLEFILIQQRLDYLINREDNVLVYLILEGCIHQTCI